MRRFLLWPVLVAFLSVGCATSGDLENLGNQLRQEDRKLESKLTAQASKDKKLALANIGALRSEMKKTIEKIKVELAGIQENLASLNKSIDLSRNIQSVQVTFNNLKEKIENSSTKLAEYTNRLNQLKTDIAKSQVGNQSVEEGVSELEGKMDELIELLQSNAQQ